MNSVFLTRRAMLSGGTLLGLGALLAACGQQATNEAAATASTAPSESASASAAVSDAASASATPSPVITRGYSGGSKAPDGEYRKADGYGPAQNVPLPKAEPQQYPETFAGLREMMRDWIKARNYGIQTGDMQYVWPYMLALLMRTLNSCTTSRIFTKAVAGLSKAPQNTRPKAI